jgi:hypothetical protein
LNGFLLKHSPKSIGQGAQAQSFGDVDRYLFGKHFTIVEVLTVPFLQRLVPLAKHFCDIDVMALCRDNHCNRLADWIDACLSRPSAVATSVPSEELVDAYKTLKERMSKSVTSSPEQPQQK